MGVVDSIKSGVSSAIISISGVKTVKDGLYSLYTVPTGDIPFVCYDVRIDQREVVSYDGKERIVSTVTVQGAIPWDTTKIVFWQIVEGIQQNLMGITVSGAGVEQVVIERFDLLDNNTAKNGLFEMVVRITLFV